MKTHGFPISIYATEIIPISSIYHALKFMLELTESQMLFELNMFFTVVWIPVKGYLANNADPDRTPQNAASDQGLHCLKIV